MAHYAMLNEYHFTADVDDIRGAELYSADGRKAGKVSDVIFDHDSGEVRYLIVDAAHDRKVLVPSSHVYRAVADEDSFATDMTTAEIERLPRFDEKMLHDEAQWREHEKEHQRAWREQEERLLAEYKENWHEAPVQHRHGSDRNITPEEEPDSAPPSAGERTVTAADLFPRRIADKFAGTQPMTVPSNPNANEITLRPAPDVDAGLGFGAAPPSPRWQGFQHSLRRSLPEIRQSCALCCRPGEARVA